MSAPAKFARVAEGLYRFSRKGKAFGSSYAYFWRGGKQIKQKLEAVDIEQARRELSALRGEKDRIDPALREMTACRSPRPLPDDRRALGATFLQYPKIFREAHQG